jgi:hypothetical protein
VAKSSKAEVPMERRKGEDRRKQNIPVTVERRKVQRRRQIDPTTCERDYTDDEIEFMQALDAYKRASGRMFPTCSEILEVIRSLGYTRVGQSPAAPPEANVGMPFPPAEASLS